jgi:hypothetical protein
VEHNKPEFVTEERKKEPPKEIIKSIKPAINERSLEMKLPEKTVHFATEERKNKSADPDFPELNVVFADNPIIAVVIEGNTYFLEEGKGWIEGSRPPLSKEQKLLLEKYKNLKLKKIVWDRDTIILENNGKTREYSMK